jgi:hypothetical protein
MRRGECYLSEDGRGRADDGYRYKKVVHFLKEAL